MDRLLPSAEAFTGDDMLRVLPAVAPEVALPSAGLGPSTEEGEPLAVLDPTHTRNEHTIERVGHTYTHNTNQQ